MTLYNEKVISFLNCIEIRNFDIIYDNAYKEFCDEVKREDFFNSVNKNIEDKDVFFFVKEIKRGEEKLYIFKEYYENKFIYAFFNNNDILEGIIFKKIKEKEEYVGSSKYKENIKKRWWKKNAKKN